MSDSTTSRPFPLNAAPFTTSEANMISTTEQYYHHLTEAGVNGAFICGTTGECSELTTDERFAMTVHWARQCKENDKFRLFVHVGGTNLPTARALASNAAIAARSRGGGVDAIAACAPSFIKPSSPDALIDYCQRIAKAAPSLPFYYYHIPSLTNVPVDIPQFVLQAQRSIPTFAGVKYSHTDLDMLKSCTDSYGETFEFLFGCDEMLLSGLNRGANGAVGSTYSFMPGPYQRVIRCYQNHQMGEAQIQQSQITAFIDQCKALPADLLAVLRYVMISVSGINLGPPRPPIQPLTSSVQEKIDRLMSTYNFFAHQDRGSSVMP